MFLKDSSEVFLSGWTIFLDTNSNNNLDPSETYTTTNGGGNYSFSNLGPGTYTVCEVGRAGWTQTFPANNGCYVVTASSGNDESGKNFGNILEREGTIGFWRNWNKHKTYNEAQINSWLVTLNASSMWLMGEAGYSANTVGMVSLINDATKNCDNATNKDLCAKRKFLAQYMVMRLNVASGRKSLASTYDLSSFSAAMSYLGISPTTSVTMSQLIARIEAKASNSPSRQQFLQVMSVCDYINNQGI